LVFGLWRQIIMGLEFRAYMYTTSGDYVCSYGAGHIGVLINVAYYGLLWLKKIPIFLGTCFFIIIILLFAIAKRTRVEY
jgi:preprotein translocase subunit SecG